MNNKQISSLITKVVVFVLLLFALLLAAINLIHHQLTLVQIVLALFVISLAISTFFAFDLVRSIKEASHAVDRISRGDFSIQPYETNSAEINNLSEMVMKLGENLQLSQENLENQRNQLNGILAYMTDGVIATDRAGRVILANTAALHLLSTSTDIILTQTIAEALKIDNYFAFRDLLERTPDISIDSENSYGEYVRLRVNFSIFRREKGNISGIVAVIHDVTESEKLEREQRAFVSNVSHELRTPLTTIKSYLETLQDGALNRPDLARDFVSTTLNEANHMIQMVSDILDLSRMDLGRTELQKEMVNIVAFLTHLVGRFKQVADNDDTLPIQYQTDFPDEQIWTEIDISKMSQVVDNILSNAVKYSPNGGTVTVTLSVTPAQLIIKISDQGMGIPAKDLPKIFDRFYRVDKARTHDAGGTGLGLAIAYDIIKLHGGTVGVKSVEGLGTEFAIVLPYMPYMPYTDEDDFDADFDDLDMDDLDFNTTEILPDENDVNSVPETTVDRVEHIEVFEDNYFKDVSLTNIKPDETNDL
ncbi:MAG: PAS domain S-box protein [Streptococcaceae bacterium]|jgi:two-component system sensor histidine kinase VicK|nr:PAS domain S-box protein [Streptococcaceae bacterium]